MAHPAWQGCYSWQKHSEQDRAWQDQGWEDNSKRDRSWHAGGPSSDESASRPGSSSDDHQWGHKKWQQQHDSAIAQALSEPTQSGSQLPSDFSDGRRLRNSRGADASATTRWLDPGTVAQLPAESPSQNVLLSLSDKTGTTARVSGKRANLWLKEVAAQLQSQPFIEELDLSEQSEKWHPILLHPQMPAKAIGDGVVRFAAIRFPGIPDHNHHDQDRIDFVAFQVNGVCCRLHPDQRSISTGCVVGHLADWKPWLAQGPDHSFTIEHISALGQKHESSYNHCCASGRRRAIAFLDSLTGQPAQEISLQKFNWLFFLCSQPSVRTEVVGPGITNAWVVDSEMHFNRTDGSIAVVSVSPSRLLVRILN